MNRLIAAIGMGVVLLAPRVATACSCAPPPTPDKAFEQATAVFVGTVQKVLLPAGQGVKTVTLNVEQAWKGLQHRKPTVTVTTCANGACCGYGFQEGEGYLVYADGEAHALTVSLCSRTRPLAKADDDIAVLNKVVAGNRASSVPPPLQEPLLRLRLGDPFGGVESVVVMPDGRCDYTPVGKPMVQSWLDKRTKAALFKTLNEQGLADQKDINLPCEASATKVLSKFIAEWIAPSADEKQKRAANEQARQQAAREADAAAQQPQANKGLNVALQDGGMTVVAIHTASGKMIWKVKLQGPAGAVRVEGNQVIVAPQNWVLDLETGKVISK